MGNEISVPLGAYVLAYNNTGVTQNYGAQVNGSLLKASYVPGSYPYGQTFVPGQLFESRGYCPIRTTCLWQRVA